MPTSTPTPEIPEFPSWIILALLVIATLAVAAASKRKSLTKPLTKQSALFSIKPQF